MSPETVKRVHQKKKKKKRKHVDVKRADADAESKHMQRVCLDIAYFVKN